ncbi:ABC transporter ATP-binding protein [candidate division bacterium WOR-3 4484_18]|uniref:ABC transporter ATP-binding protein n=1 Tax=candidate division WOR-3 bacterium 4484_18 TaxID=2020626 RepID=A0A257LUT6_UNCW3|nr:MAG: ABC transporter ATP-binding protein [candidate division bacterium WOR-3 4484_18]
MIEIKDLHKSFGDNHVLRGVNLTIPEKKITVILGRSGVGKSVLLKHIIGLLKPDSGNIFIDGIDITRASSRELWNVRKRMAMVFQGSALLDSLPVWENVTLALRVHDHLPEEDLRRIACDKLTLVEMAGSEEFMPSELSGGMKKRVAIARALAIEPKYLLFDEPTTGLDPLTAQKINELIKDLQKTLGLTAIIVTHDLQCTFTVADKIAMLAEGKIIFEGDIEGFKTSNIPLIKQYLATFNITRG